MNEAIVSQLMSTAHDHAADQNCTLTPDVEKELNDMIFSGMTNISPGELESEQTIFKASQSIGELVDLMAKAASNRKGGGTIDMSDMKTALSFFCPRTPWC